jgi:hypothetical protein
MFNSTQDYLLSSTQDYLKWISEKKKIEMSLLVNSIRTSKKIDDKTPEMALARDIAARNSLGCGLVRSHSEKIDVPMTVSDAKRQFLEMTRNEKNTNSGHTSISNIQIRGIITGISGFMIINRCRQCGKEIKSKRICRCGGEATARLSVLAEISDSTGTMHVVCEDRIAEIILAAHPAQIARRIYNIQRGFLFMLKLLENKSNENETKIKASSGTVSHLRSIVNPDYAKALIGLPVCAAGNLFWNKNGKINMKIFWFETLTYGEEGAFLNKQSEILQGAKNPLILKRLECLKKL